MAIDWETPPDVALEQMTQAHINAIHSAILRLAEFYAPQMEAWMKSNASWVDRTANARQTLWAEEIDFVDSIVLAFGHGVEYGVFLELANAGKYAILGPAIDHFAPKLWRDVQSLMAR